MKNKTFVLSRSVYFTTVITLGLFVISLLSSCSLDTLTLYRVNIDTSNNSRELNALVGDSDISGDFDVYYKSIYKGTGSPYGNMSESDAYISLPTEGILLSQELWEIKVILANKVDNPDSTISVSDSSNYPNVSSGDIFLNLNTSTIRIAIGFGECTDYNLSVSVYKFDTQNNSFPHKSNSDIGSE